MQTKKRFFAQAETAHDRAVESPSSWIVSAPFIYITTSLPLTYMYHRTGTSQQTLDVDPMLAHRPRRRPNIKTTSGQRLVFAGMEACYWLLKNPCVKTDIMHGLWKCIKMLNTLNIDPQLNQPLLKPYQNPFWIFWFCVGPTL